MRRKVALGVGETERVACASATAFRGLDTVSGEVLGATVLGDRVGWLTSLVEAMAAGVIGGHWTRAELARLIDGHHALGHHPEHAGISKRRERLNAAIARAAARFMVNHARAAGSSVIYLEDLRDMEASGKGRTLNTRLSTTVRGHIVADVRHAAARHGIAVVIVPARGTSRYCPRCLTAFNHHTAPNSTKPGWKWAICPNARCGYSADRDVAAWQRIGARGLQHQHLTVLDRTSGTYVIRRTIQELDRPVQHSPHPDSPTPRGPQDCSVDRTKAGPTRNRPVPRQRRRVPAPPGTPAATPTGPGGKRPAGRPPQPPTHRTQQWRRRQAPHTMSTPNRHQPHGARLGAGFHLHTHATPTHKRAGQHGSRDSFPTGANTQPHPGKPKLIRDANGSL